VGVSSAALGGSTISQKSRGIEIASVTVSEKIPEAENAIGNVIHIMVM